MLFLKRLTVYASATVALSTKFPLTVLSTEAEVEDLMNKMASDTLEFASEIERVYENRCFTNNTIECAKGNYDSCSSEFPNQSCPGGETFSIPVCGEGGTCSGLFDFTATSVELPDEINKGVNNNPVDIEVKETMCYTLQAEPYMVKKFQNEKRYWAQFDVDPPQVFFGSVNGPFRIHPARQEEYCGKYDPRKRPWYIAASSGPKDVVLILDTSGSMNQKGRLELMKEAATTVVERLTVGDHVAIVSFNSGAQYLLKNTMSQANKENRERLVISINQMEAGGNTNFLAAFNLAYDILKTSKENELSSNCHTAILFLTDGMMTKPDYVTAQDVIQLITNRNNEIKINPYIFLYGLGYEANKGMAASDLQKIACGTGGLWSQVEDGGDLSTAMANFYKLFALGLGEGENEGFVAWVDPYKFSTGGIMGTTVSAPVYDRTVTPPVLVGVVGDDFTMEAMDKALGVEAGSRETLEKLVRRSTAVCPKLNLTECGIQSLRYSVGGEEALCPDECRSFVGIVPKTCRATSDLPTDFWENTRIKGRTFRERVCCKVGETRISGQYTLEELRSQECVSRGREKYTMIAKLIAAVLSVTCTLFSWL